MNRSVEAVIDWANRYGADLQRRAGEIDRHGAIPADITSQLRTSGVFKLWLPAELGGFEATPDKVVQIVSTLSRSEASTGWIAAVGIASNTVASYLSRSVAEQMFATGNEFAAGNLAPLGMLRTTANGALEATGTWPFGSGVEHADWVICGVRPAEQSVPYDVAVLHRRDITTIDPWQAVGLRASGSGHYHVQSAFVSPNRCFISRQTQPWPHGSLWRLPMSTLLFAAIAGVAIGIGQRAADVLITAADSSSTDGDNLSYEQIAKALAGMNSADAYLCNSLRRLSSTDPTSPDMARIRLEARLAIINAGQSAATAVDMCYRMAGSQAFAIDSPAQRAWRDINTAIQHTAISAKSYPRVGRDIATLASPLFTGAHRTGAHRASARPVSC
jgi:alkylation response protein AidB-like acyl-CoA dehydrogenase